MRARAWRERAPWLGWALLCACGVASCAVLAVGGNASPLPFAVAISAIGLASIGYLVWRAEPAWTLTAAIVLSVFGGNWNYLGWPDALPITPDRLLLIGAVAVVVFRGPGADQLPYLRVRPIHWLLLATLGFAIASAIAAGTLFTDSGFFRLFDRFGIAPFVAFAVAPVVYPTARERRVLLAALVGLGGYLGATAFFETVGPRALVLPGYIVDPVLGYHSGRARGPFLEAEASGLALFFCGTAAAIALATWRSGWARITAAGVVVLCTLGCLLTLQRAVWLGATVAFVVTFLSFRDLRRYLLPALAGAAAVVIAALALTPGLEALVGERAIAQNSVWDRTNLNNAATRMVEERPLLGFGWGRFGADSPPYFWQEPGTPLTAVGPEACAARSTAAAAAEAPCTQVSHNTYLSNAAELGLIGTTMWAACLLFAIGAAIVRRASPELQPWRVGLLAVAVMWGVVHFFTPMEGPFSPVLLWVWTGIVLAGSWSNPESPDPTRGRADGVTAHG